MLGIIGVHLNHEIFVGLQCVTMQSLTQIAKTFPNFKLLPLCLSGGVTIRLPLSKARLTRLVLEYPMRIS